MSSDASRARAIPAMFALGGVWGGSFLFIKVVVDETGPFELVAGRILFGFVAVAGFVAITRRPWTWPSRTLLAQMTLLALLANVIPFALISWAEEHIESGTASVLNATVPIFTAVVAAAALDEEEFTRPRAIGLLLGFIGVGVLTGTESLDVTDSSMIGQLAVVAAALCYGIAAVMLRTMIKGQDLVNVTLLQLALAGLLSIPILLVVTGGPSYSLSIEAWLSLVTLGVFGTGLGYVGWVWMIEVLGSVRASLVTYIVPVVALVLGWLVLDESVGVNTIAGFLLIIAGVATVMRGAAPASRRPVDVAPAAAGE